MLVRWYPHFIRWGLHTSQHIYEALPGGAGGSKPNFLVDTGAVDCLAPASQLKAAGIRREGKRMYELANGTAVEMQYGFARISFIGSQTVGPIIFGPEGREPILGVVALESTGIVVDPRSHTLRRLHASPLKFIGSKGVLRAARNHLAGR